MKSSLLIRSHLQTMLTTDIANDAIAKKVLVQRTLFLHLQSYCSDLRELIKELTFIFSAVNTDLYYIYSYTYL